MRTIRNIILHCTAGNPSHQCPMFCENFGLKVGLTQVIIMLFFTMATYIIYWQIVKLRTDAKDIIMTQYMWLGWVVLMEVSRQLSNMQR